MPIKPLYGDAITPGSVGPRKTPTNPAPKASSAPIQIDRWFRNIQHPDANALNMMAEAANQAVMFRSRQVFNGASRIDSPGTMITSFGAGDRARWRFSFVTSPWTHALYVVAIIAAPTSGYTNNTKVRLDIFSDTAESTVVATRDLIYGAGPTGSTTADGFPYLRVVTGYLDGLSVDTAYYAKFTDVDYGRIISAVVCELPSLTQYNSGYVAMNASALTPVVDSFRENLVSLTNSLWQKAGATVLTFSVNDGTAPITRTGATPVNILDTSVTTVSSSSPGYTLQMSNKARLSQSSGVPCVMKAFAKWTKGASVNSAGGTLLLKDSAGSTVASISDGWSSATPVWVSTTLNLPASQGKYDLMWHSDSGGGSAALYAVSIYERD